MLPLPRKLEFRFPRQMRMISLIFPKEKFADIRSVKTNAFIILLVFGILLQMLSQSLLICNYVIRVDYYTSVCVNKAKPSMHCNGKCHLAKELKEEEKRDHSPAGLEKNTMEVFCVPESLTTNFSIGHTKEHLFANIVCNLPNPTLSALFHPPASLS